MQRALAQRVLARLHEAQATLYSGGSDAAVKDVLTEDIVWHVPGENAIAGTYEGLEQVMRYFERRRDIASSTFRMHPGEMLLGDGDHVAVLTDGTATIDGERHRWSTVGLYRLRAERIAECWLLPLDPARFDRVWGRATLREGDG